MLSFHTKKAKEGIKPFICHSRKQAILFLSPFYPSHLELASGEIHGSRVLGQQQYFHLQSRIYIYAKVNDT